MFICGISKRGIGEYALRCKSPIYVKWCNISNIGFNGSGQVNTRYAR
jgi:hypothetical protein